VRCRHRESLKNRKRVGRLGFYIAHDIADAILRLISKKCAGGEIVIRKPENFPQQVKDVRLQLELSQEELAHALGVSFATVNRWENGKTTPSKLALRQFEKFCSEKKVQGEFRK
jgi:DNA-binding transcriptional regulator YiaG